MRVATGAAIACLAIVAVASMPVDRRRAGQGSRSAPVQHVVPVDGHPISVWARVPADVRATVVLVHGRTWSSLPDFDLQVDGLNRSVMQSLADRGVAAYAVDLRGYGPTPRDASGWLTPRRAADDVSHVLDWVRERHPAVKPPALVGWSQGAAIAMLAAQQERSALSSLVLFGFAFDPATQFAGPARPAEPPRQSNTAEAARRDFISPAVTAPAVIRAFVAQALRADPVTVDLRDEDEFNDLDPRQVSVPVLVIYGDRDPALSPTLIERMTSAFTAPPTVVVLRGADHVAHLESTHDGWIAAVSDFIGR